MTPSDRIASLIARWWPRAVWLALAGVGMVFLGGVP